MKYILLLAILVGCKDRVDPKGVPNVLTAVRDTTEKRGTVNVGSPNPSINVSTLPGQRWVNLKGNANIRIHWSENGFGHVVRNKLGEYGIMNSRGEIYSHQEGLNFNGWMPPVAIPHKLRGWSREMLPVFFKTYESAQDFIDSAYNKQIIDSISYDQAVKRWAREDSIEKLRNTWE
jgi:hypothetical protein